MSAQQVFEEMVYFHKTTGQVMQKDMFIDLIFSKFDKDEIIDGLIVFNNYLDAQRTAVE